MRAILTMLGIIGVAAVLDHGLRAALRPTLPRHREQRHQPAHHQRRGSRGTSSGDTLTMADAGHVDGACPSRTSARSPQYTSNGTLTKGDNEGNYQVVGTTANYAAITNMDIASGSLFHR
ncbi:MAG: ABC transporter permease [Caldilineaceae bacterium]